MLAEHIFHHNPQFYTFDFVKAGLLLPKNTGFFIFSKYGLFFFLNSLHSETFFPENNNHFTQCNSNLGIL